MSDTPSPSLLSEERLAEMATWAKTLQGPRSGPAHVRDGEMLDELLADRTAYRLAVAEQLRGLLVSDPTEAEYHSESPALAAASSAAIKRNAAIRAAARALSIDLTT